MHISQEVLTSPKGDRVLMMNFKQGLKISMLLVFGIFFKKKVPFAIIEKERFEGRRFKARRLGCHGDYGSMH